MITLLLQSVKYLLDGLHMTLVSKEPDFLLGVEYADSYNHSHRYSGMKLATIQPRHRCRAIGLSFTEQAAYEKGGQLIPKPLKT